MDYRADPSKEHPRELLPGGAGGGGAGGGSHACRANSQGSKGSAFSSEPHMCTAMCVLACVSHGFMCDLVTSECTLMAFPYHLTLNKPTTWCQGGFIAFFKDDKCTDINIFLVSTVRLFLKGMELAFSPTPLVLFILDISNLLCA